MQGEKIYNISAPKKVLTLLERRGIKYTLCTAILYALDKYLVFLDKGRSTLPLMSSSDHLVMKNINGSEMFLDVADEGLSHDLIEEGVRETFILGTIKRELRKGQVVIDIGSNIGYYALLEAKVVGDEGKVYAIEPVPESREILKKNIEINKYSNVEEYPFAVGDESSVATIYVRNKLNLSSFRESDQGTCQDNVSTTKKVQVQVVTLDDFIKDKANPDIIRMDTEGHEYQIIKGMGEILRKNLPLILFIEFHFNILEIDQSIETLETLKQSGFKIKDVTLESTSRGFQHHKTLWRMIAFLDKKREGFPAPGHRNLTIDGIISKSDILNGRWGALEICFER